MKKVLITGGATGIGKATALLFKQKGYDVFITYNQSEPDFDGIAKIKCNLENENEIIELFNQIGSIDVLVNNAGISLIKQINDTTAEEYDKVMRINARSYFLCSREAVKLMLKSHSGAIVNVSSMWGQLGASCEIAYSMSKAAVCPGIIDTRMNSMFEKSELEEEVPIGRLGTAEEVADAIYFLSQNKYITSQILGVNGGIV